MNELEKDSECKLSTLHFCFALDRAKGGGAGGVFLTAIELTKFGITSEIFSSGNTRKQLAANSSSWAELRKFDITVRYSITPVENDYGFGFSLDYLRQLQKIEKPSLVILHQVYTLSTFLGYRYARKNGIPYAVFPHGSLTNYDEANSSLKKAIAKRVVISKILREASVIIVTCESEKADLQKSIQSKAVLLPYGAELKNELLEKRIASGGDSQYPRILFSGRFDKKKNLPLLLAAMPQIISKFPHAVLDIAGSGSKRDVDVLLNLAHQLKIESNVVFHGWVDKSEMENLFVSARLLVLPSDNENFAQVVSEALSAGVPCVVSKFVGTSEIVAKHHAGEIIEVLTPESVAAAVIKVLQGDEETYREAALTATREDLDWSKIALQWRTLLTSLA
jgi:glycosyltransferase involved in cell wall biosynthesis